MVSRVGVGGGEDECFSAISTYIGLLVALSVSVDTTVPVYSTAPNFLCTYNPTILLIDTDTSSSLHEDPGAVGPPTAFVDEQHTHHDGMVHFAPLAFAMAMHSLTSFTRRLRNQGMKLLTT